MTTAVLVDDEGHLLDYLESKLAEVWPELDIAGKAANGSQALALCADTVPDVVFLDIHMPGMNGLEVAQHLSSTIAVVFVTAYDQYAIEAFETAAVDYLLKPVTAERLAQTVLRLKSRDRDERRSLATLLQALSRPPSSTYLRWLRTGLGDTLEIVSVNDVVYFHANHKYTSVMCAGREFVLRKSIKALAAELDPNEFWQVHRGIIVRVDQVQLAERDLRGRYALTLKSRPEKLRTSSAHAHLFRQM